MSHYKFLMADFDGTLHNSVILVDRATNIVLKRRGYSPVDRDNIVEGMLRPTSERMAFHAGIDDIDAGEEMGREFYTVFHEILSEGVLFDGVHKLIDTLTESDIPMGIISNNRSDIIHAVTDRLGLTDRFAFIFGEDNARAVKPSPGGIFHGCEILGMSPAEGIFIGDSETDCLAAKNAGMLSVGVAWNRDAGDDVTALGFDEIVHHPLELLNYFKLMVPAN